MLARAPAKPRRRKPCAHRDCIAGDTRRQMFPFPLPCDDCAAPAECRSCRKVARWRRLCGLPDVVKATETTETKGTKRTKKTKTELPFVCIEHFVGEGPTAAWPDPFPVVTGFVPDFASVSAHFPTPCDNCWAPGDCPRCAKVARWRSRWDAARGTEETTESTDAKATTETNGTKETKETKEMTGTTETTETKRTPKIKDSNKNKGAKGAKKIKAAKAELPFACMEHLEGPTPDWPDQFLATSTFHSQSTANGRCAKRMRAPSPLVEAMPFVEAVYDADAVSHRIAMAIRQATTNSAKQDLQSHDKKSRSHHFLASYDMESHNRLTESQPYDLTAIYTHNSDAKSPSRHFPASYNLQSHEMETKSLDLSFSYNIQSSDRLSESQPHDRPAVYAHESDTKPRSHDFPASYNLQSHDVDTKSHDLARRSFESRDRSVSPDAYDRGNHDLQSAPSVRCQLSLERRETRRLAAKLARCQATAKRRLAAIRELRARLKAAEKRGKKGK